MLLIVPDYVAERTIADRISPQEAERSVRAQHLQLLPNGRQTVGHYFLRIARVSSAEWLGGVWTFTDLATRTAFLYNITVFPKFRRQGIARDALVLLQDHVRALGCTTLALNVFATNVGARGLYKSMGFGVVRLSHVWNLVPQLLLHRRKKLRRSVGSGAADSLRKGVRWSNRSKRSATPGSRLRGSPHSCRGSRSPRHRASTRECVWRAMIRTPDRARRRRACRCTCRGRC